MILLQAAAKNRVFTFQL